MPVFPLRPFQGQFRARAWFETSFSWLTARERGSGVAPPLCRAGMNKSVTFRAWAG